MGVNQTTLALTGNTYFPQAVSRFEHVRFKQVVEFVRSTDVAITNLECSIPDAASPPAFVAGAGWAATYLAGTPDLLQELRFLGFDAVCAANNHVSDFGDSGILATIRRLREAQLPFAGIGASLAEASQAAYIDAPTGLRIALISVCDWGPRGRMGLNFPWPHGYMPSDDGPLFTPRPGVNLLRYEAVSQVARDQLDTLRQISASLGWERDKAFRRSGFWRSHPLVGMTTNIGVEVDSETEFYFLGRKFVVGDRPSQQTVLCQDDLDRVYRQIREARRQADVVCVSLHDQSQGEAVHDYIRVFAHGAIDAGADVYFSNGGSHRGVELYKGKALIYGQPGFFLQTEAVTHVPSSAMLRYGLPADSTAADFLDARERRKDFAFHEAGGGPGQSIEGAGGTVIHVCVFNEDARLVEIRLQPLETMGGNILRTDDQDGPVRRFLRGLPLMPEPGSGVAHRVLNHSAECSRPYGTDVAISDGVGCIKLV
jgi:poly-gamma-glutamate capsule biosynthesis protein CapA/YwtB (metallophosphatase superfamily)